jgi:hypothetical protein
MFGAFHRIFASAFEQLSQQIELHLPPLLVALTMLLGAWLIALLARLLLMRLFKGMALERFVQQSGLLSLMGGPPRFPASRVVASVVYWAVLGVGLLAALNVFNTQITTRMAETVMLLTPKVLTAGAIILAGAWLGRYLGRGALVWACNEDLPGARRLAAAVRFLILFLAVVLAADQLDFGRTVFLLAFLLLVGGGVLALGLGLGLGARDAFREYLGVKLAGREEHHERSLWSHL